MVSGSTQSDPMGTSSPNERRRNIACFNQRLNTGPISEVTPRGDKCDLREPHVRLMDALCSSQKSIVTEHVSRSRERSESGSSNHGMSSEQKLPIPALPFCQKANAANFKTNFLVPRINSTTETKGSEAFSLSQRCKNK